MTWGFSYKEDRRLIELARDKKKSAEGIAHLMGRPPNTIRRWAVSPIGDFPEKAQAKVEPDQTPNTITRSSMSAPGAKAEVGSGPH
jgi:hypothetical protein